MKKNTDVKKKYGSCSDQCACVSRYRSGSHLLYAQAQKRLRRNLSWQNRSLYKQMKKSLMA